MADVYGSDGYDIDEYGNMVPKGTAPGVRINSVPDPTLTATPGSPGGPQLSTPQGGPVATRPITTPLSSSGQPAVRDPSASSFQPPATQTKPGLLTPSSSRPAGGYPIQINPNPMIMPGGLSVGGALGTGIGALSAAPSSQADVEYRLNHPLTATDLWNTAKGWFTANPQSAAAPQTQTQPQTALAPPSGAPTATATPPPPPPPPGYPPLPPSRPPNLPPFVRGPIPAAMPQHTPVQRAGQPNLGYGVPQPAQDPFAIHPSNAFTTIDRPNADVAGGRSVAGQLAPQYFNQAREPGGPAQMGALDLSSLFNHPAVAVQAAAHPMVQAAARAPVQGPLSALAPQRAPVVQQQWSLPQVRKGGAAVIRPTYGNPATGGSTVGMGN